MGTLNFFTQVQKKVDHDSLLVSAKRITGTVRTLLLKDLDTESIIAYIPTLEITGYGNDKHEAMEMLKVSVREFFDFLGSLSKKMRDVELRRLGWKNQSLGNKEFSKAYIDANGVLQNMNVQELEVLTLQAA